MRKWILLAAMFFVSAQAAQGGEVLDWLANSAGDFFRDECDVDNTAFALLPDRR